MNLSEKRKEAGLKQEEVAEIIGVSRAAYSNIEIGRRRPSVSTAKRIAALLGFDWTEFYDDEQTADSA